MNEFDFEERIAIVNLPIQRVFTFFGFGVAIFFYLLGSRLWFMTMFAVASFTLLGIVNLFAWRKSAKYLNERAVKRAVEGVMES